MITTKEFFEMDADNIIFDLETYWTIQRDRKQRYINEPFPSKEDFIHRYETGLDDPFDELSDYDDLPEEEEQKMIQEQINRISDVYDRVLKTRTEFEKSFEEE